MIFRCFSTLNKILHIGYEIIVYYKMISIRKTYIYRNPNKVYRMFLISIAKGENKSSSIICLKSLTFFFQLVENLQLHNQSLTGYKSLQV